MESAQRHETMQAAQAAGMNRRDRKKFNAALKKDDPAALAAAEAQDWASVAPTSERLVSKPSWATDETKWSDDQAAVTSAFRDVLGRDPASENELNRWLEVAINDGRSSVAQLLSLSDEARRRGVDPTVYGNEAVDPAAFTGWKKDFYEEWAKQNPGKTFYSGNMTQLQWQKDFGSLATYQALGDGSIQRGRGGEYVVTQEAVDRYGADNLSFTGYHYGDIILAPKDSGIRVGGQVKRYEGLKEDDKNYEAESSWRENWENQGYEIFQGQGPKPHEGFMDRIKRELVEHTGMSEDAASTLMFVGSGGTTGGDFIQEVLGIREGLFMTDPGGFTSGWFYGDRGNRENLEGAASFLGMDKNDPDDMNQIARYQGYGAAAFTTALSMTGWGAPVAAGLNAARQMGRAQTGQQDWGTAVGNAAISLVASRLGGAYGGDYSGAYNAAVQASSAALQTAITNEDSHTVDKQDIGTAAAVGALGGIAGGVSNAAGGAYNLGPLSQGFLNAAAQSAASYGGAYLSAWGNGGEVDSESAAFNAILAGASGFGTGYGIGKRNQSERDLMRRYDDAFDKMNIPMPGSGDRAGLTPAEAAALGPRPPETFAERLSYEFGGLDENNEFSWFSNRRPQAEPAPLSAVQRAEQYLLDKATPWATGHEQYVRDGGWLTDAVDKYTTDLGASQLVESGWAAPAAYFAPGWAEEAPAGGAGPYRYEETIAALDRLFAEPYDFSGLRLAPGR